MIGDIVLAPLLPLPWLVAAIIVGALLCDIAAVRRGRGAVARLAAFAVLTLGLLDPRLVREERRPSPDVALVVLDRSPSQEIGERRRQLDEAAAELRERLGRLSGLEVRVIEAGEERGVDATRLFAAAERAAAEAGPARLGALFLLTDGQVHDAPAEGSPPGLSAPVHALLMGAPGETDRRVLIEHAPAYGLVGAPVQLRYRIDDLGAQPASSVGRVPVRFRVGAAAAGSAQGLPGRSETLGFVLDRAGPTAVEIEVAPLPGEVSTRNNRAAVVINGVRDRLRVLLVSGQPHLGERTWRNLLKSDPAVDLVHFTILRPPEKEELTPLRELSLIVFPVQELFEKRLHDFDLIVFDRYAERGVLIDAYFDAIARFVEDGGALLVASGPEYAGPLSLQRTALRRALPAVPSARTVETPFTPTVTPLGRRHPVTTGLGGDGSTGEGDWGRWFRLVEAEASRGSVLMTGAGGRPLLIVDRLGEGRVAQLLSDQVWLWARGFEGGGPYAELIRRLAHWLMKEPELEEDAIKAIIADGRLAVERRSLEAAGDGATVTVTTPLGEERILRLEPRADGLAAADTEAPEPGLYRVGDGDHTAVAVAGGLGLAEYADLRASAEPLRRIVAASGGGIVWLAAGMPEIRAVAAEGGAAGRGWLGVRRQRGYEVTGSFETPLLPGPLLVVFGLGTLMLAWWREGR